MTTISDISVEYTFRAHLGGIVVFITTILCCIGLSLLTAGYTLTSLGSYIYEKHDLEKTLDDFRDGVPHQFPNDYWCPIEKGQGFYGIFTHTISYALLFLGTWFMLITFGGCIVTNTISRTPLFVYTIFVVLLTGTTLYTFLVAEQILFIDFQYTLENYSGLGDNSLEGIAWNLLMINFKCCGIYGNDEFMSLKSWPPKDLNKNVSKEAFIKEIESRKKRAVDATYTQPRGCQDVGQQYECSWMDIEKFKTPLVCCKDPKSIIDGCHLDGIAGESNNRMETGCLTKLFGYVDGIGFTHVMFYLVMVVLFTYILVLCTLIYYNCPYQDDEFDEQMCSKHEEVEVIEEIVEEPSEKAESRKTTGTVETAEISLTEDTPGKDAETRSSSV